MILIKKAKIDMRSCPKWKREESEESGTINKESDETAAKTKHGHSRTLTCQACGGGIETKNMQLWSLDGFRDFYCKKCGHHARAKGHRCQCGTIWHECPEHRLDPAVHRSRKAPNKEKGDEHTFDMHKESSRPAPDAAVKRRRKQMQTESKPKVLHAHGNKAADGPLKQLMPAVLERHNKRKAAEAEMHLERSHRRGLSENYIILHGDSAQN